MEETKKLLLAVCTGNTCRSPMAAAVLNRILTEKGLPYRAESAGIAAFNGQAASVNAIEAAKMTGLDLSGHRSRRLTPELLGEAERIFVMTEEHREFLSALPGVAEKLVVLGVPDPYGKDLAAYRDCLRALEAALTKELEEHPL